MNLEFTFLGYTLICGLILMVSALCYIFLCKDKTAPEVSRRIILFIYFLMFAIPIISALIPIGYEHELIHVGLPQAIGFQQVGETEDATLNGFYLQKIRSVLLYCYLAGATLMILSTVINVIYLSSLKKKSAVEVIKGKRVYLHTDSSLGTFSWLTNIFIYDGSVKLIDEGQLQLLIKHEEIHIGKYHWIDLILSRFVLIFQWFNPAAWFLRNELQRVHEFEADKEILEQGNDIMEYQRLLIKNISINRTSGLTDGLNNCSLKTRIIMMNNQTIPRHSVLRGLVIGMFALAGGLIIHFPAVGAFIQTNENSLSKNPQTSASLPADIKGKENPVYYIDGEKVTFDKVDELPSTSIERITIDKQSDIPTVNVTTKNLYAKEGTEVLKSAEKMPCYEGGERALMNAIAENIKYPQSEIDNENGGIVVLQFVVNTDGTMGDFKIVRSQGEAFDNAALNAIKSVKGRWEPGMNAGVPVRVVYTLPITFSTKTASSEGPDTKKG